MRDHVAGPVVEPGMSREQFIRAGGCPHCWPREPRSIEDHAAGLVDDCPGCRRMAIDIAAARAEADDAHRRWWDRLDEAMVLVGRVVIAVAILWLVLVVAPELVGG